MRLLGVAAIYQRPNTSKPTAAHKIYPYLLRGLTIERVNQVWCADVTSIPMAKGFVYLVVIMDWVSRAVLAWRLSNTLDADFCVEALEEALARYSRPEIFNTDQGSQFTSDDFTGILKRHGVTISMDGKGRYMDNILSSGCGAVSNTRRSTSMPMRLSPKPRLVLASGWTFTTPSASIRVWVIARRVRSTRTAYGYVDDRRRRPAALPPLPEPARKAGKCSPSPTYPQAPLPTTDLIDEVNSRRGKPAVPPATGAGIETDRATP